ncbi:MAG: HipA domain-containing protein [Hydrogenophaga sp.]|nr:HipA domain-containing protein [Hydrogenophaga sp.]
MNLPEGFFPSILQEQLGPHVGASPLNLLSVVGRNAIGRVKVAAPGADPTQPPVPFELASILRGDNSEAAFVELVRRYAASGVSGVVPKFLSPHTLAEHGKGTLATDRHIIKGTTARLPGVALNEHFCMEVSRQAGIPIAQTEVSDDGQALVVHRFDVEDDGVTRKGMEDLCSLPSLDQAIEQARFSDVKPIAPTPQEKIGRSPCWGNAEGQLNCPVSRTGVERLAGAFQRH